MVWWSYGKWVGVQIWTAEVMEQNRSVSLCRVKDLASAFVLFPCLGTGCLYSRGIGKEGDEELSREMIFRGIYVDYKLENNYKVFGPFILQEKGQVWSSNKV